MRKIYKRSEKVRIWIKYCVIPSFVPIAISILIDFYMGYTFIQVIKRHCAEGILIFFALAVSILNSAVSVDKNDEKRRDYIGVSFFGGVCYAIFFVLFYAVPDGKLFVKIIIYLSLYLIGFGIIYKGMEVEEVLEKELEKEKKEKEELKTQISMLMANNP